MTLLVLYGRQYWEIKNAQDDYVISDAGKTLVERSLSGSKVLDVAMIPNHKEAVNYVYNKMYGVEVTYERNGKVKKIIFPMSRYKSTLISPNKTDFYVLDDKADVIYTTKSK